MSKVVASLVSDIINPVLGLILGAAGGLQTASFSIGDAEILLGSFLSTVIDFAVIAAVIVNRARSRATI